MAASRIFDAPLHAAKMRNFSRAPIFQIPRRLFCIGFAVGVLNFANAVRADILWSDLGATLVHDTGAGSSFLTGSAMDILGGAAREDDSSTNTLYFKFHVDPLSDVNTEEYFAAFQLYEGETERLAIGNSLKAWAYSAFKTDETGDANKVFGDMDLHSAMPEPAALGTTFTYEFPRRGNERTIVFKVQYVAGGKDLVTVWLNPDLTAGATEQSQLKSLVTKFTADASFNQIRLRHGGGGGGWTFSDMAIATSFSDFVASSSIESDETAFHYNRGTLAFNVKTWQRDQGLPQNAIRALAQTRDGYVWIGCDDGVARFDGLRFVSFGVRDGLRGGPVRALLGDSRGALWVGSAEGLSRWADGYFTTFTTNEGLPARAITALAEDANGHIWVGSENGLAIGKNGHFAVPVGGEIFKGKPVTTLFKDRKGNMWIGATGAGIFCFRNGKFSPLNDGSVESLLQDPHCILIDQSGRIWIGAGDDFVLCRVGGQWHRFRIPRHLARPYITALAEEPDGTVWAGSISEGLFQFRGGKLAAFNAGSGLPDNLVESLLVDREGKLWVGTDSGLSRLRRKRLFAFGQNDGLGYGAVQSIAEIAPGIIWAAKANGGLCRWAGRTFSRVAAPGLDGDLRVHALLATHDGGCWVADEKELRFFENAADSPVESKADALTNADVIALAQGADGAIWAGTRYGKLWHWQNSRWTRKENFEPNCAITAIEPDRDGGLWIGTDGNGLFRLRNSQHTQFNKNNGLVSDSIRTLYLDAQGTLWIGTSGGGLSRWNGREIKTFTTREGLPDNTISQILEDSSGRLWLGSNQGVASVSKRDLEELANGKVPAIYPKIFGLADGMLSEECTSGFFPAGLKIKPGLLWFSTAKGIVVADARPHAADVIAPRAVIEEMLLDGVGFAGFQPTEMSERSPRANGGKAEREFHIKPGRHRLEFRYTGLGFDAPERMRFRYQLEGLDPDWVEAGTRRVAFYSYVPPGKYRFRVIACNNDGVWDETGATVAFVVMRHFWQAGWVIFLGVAGVLISVGGAARFMEKRRLHRRLVHLEQERALQRERARIAEDLHDDLGSSLARISLLSGLAKADKENPGQVESHVNKIAQSAAQTVRALEEIVWAVRPGSDSLQSLVEYIAHFASELFDGNTTRCRLDLPHDLPPRALPPDVRHNIFLIVKEALTNALKHASAGEVRVQAKVSMNTLEITVQDDGNGFDPNIPRAEGKQNGLGNMRRRAEAVAGTLDVQTARGKGTVVKLIVNLKNISPDAAS